MSTYLEALDVIQSGVQTTLGTPVAATGKHAVSSFVVTPIDKVDDPSILNGLAIANDGYEIIVNRGVTWSVGDSPLFYDEIQKWLGMALAAPVITGANPYTYTSTALATSAAIPNFRTFEASMSDGVTPLNYRFEGACLTDLEISAPLNGQWRFNAKGFGRVNAVNAQTAALSLPATILGEASALSDVRIDSVFANLGTTLIGGTTALSSILGWKWKVFTGLYAQDTVEGRANLDYTVIGFDPSKRKATLEIEILANSVGQWATEATAAKAATLRAVELRGVNGTNSIKIGGLYRYKPLGDIFPQTPRNGQKTLKLMLETSTDQTNWLRSIVINSTATLV